MQFIEDLKICLILCLVQQTNGVVYLTNAIFSGVCKIEGW